MAGTCVTCYMLLCDTATTQIYPDCHTLALNDARPIYRRPLPGFTCRCHLTGRPLAPASRLPPRRAPCRSGVARRNADRIESRSGAVTTESAWGEIGRAHV